MLEVDDDVVVAGEACDLGEGGGVREEEEAVEGIAGGEAVLEVGGGDGGWEGIGGLDGGEGVGFGEAERRARGGG